jgi:hypothetical protein
VSEISDAARAQVFLADYAAVDASNKINALGLGFQVCPIQANGFTTPLSVVGLIDIPIRHVGDDCAIELVLMSDSEEIVTAAGPTGEATPLRFSQHVNVAQPTFNLPGLRVPKDAAWARHQIVATFLSGLPLATGHGYEWRIFVDTNTRSDWSVGFYVPGPAGSLLVG